ncbi:hypothetical protein BASA61_008758 [Batrachochytrium salamandrivorans]|nr:hypothetical protein BASA61_008758 [Batrachochytrium salamandrivorans]
MRVDIGIILSVLSFSVLAKAIPNDGYNGPLLVRRAVGPDTTDLLWKRADDDGEQGPSPMDLDIGAEADASSDDSSSNQPSGSGELSELYRTSNPSDEESIQTVIEKVTEAFEGENKDEFISKIKTVLTIVLNSVRVFLAAYDSKDTAPFVLMIPKGTTDQQSSIEKLSICKILERVWSLENRAYVDVTESYIRQVWSDGDRVSELLDKIERMTDSGMIKPKPVPSIFSSLMSSIKKRLGINDGPPADTTTD